jgi:hypothetical protein
MRTVRFNPENLTGEKKAWWDRWEKRATKARNNALKAYNDWLASAKPRQPFKPPENQNVWSDLKWWLVENVFNKRCAYCESPLIFDRSRGDAEHYRPKGSVIWRDDNGDESRAQCELHDGEIIDHPGYFWLAYDWRNLVPACADCNSGNGKVDQFPVGSKHLFQLRGAAFPQGSIGPHPKLECPVGSGKYFPEPDTLDAGERPLLLNPLNPGQDRDPINHLRYSVGGRVIPVGGSKLGENSIRVFDLKREEIRQRRQEAQELAQMNYYLIRARKFGPDRQVEEDALLDKYRAGLMDFSSAALDHLQFERDDQQRPIRAVLAAVPKAP